jgi:hypothetical protein
VTSTCQVDRAPVWLELLCGLTEISPSWVVWKNVDSALHGFGDIDSAAPRSEWPALSGAFRRWAAANRLGPVIECPHAPNLMHLVALNGDEPFLELDLVGRKVFLGSTLFLPEDLAPLIEMDARGFRRLRSGAEGLIKLVGNGTRRNGLPNPEGLRAKRIPELLAGDPEGVREAGRLFGPAERAVLDLAHAVVQGGWDRRAAVAMEGWFLLRALGEPGSVVNRLRFRVAARRCPVLRAVFADRQVPADATLWMHRVAGTHRIFDDRP